MTPGASNLLLVLLGALAGTVAIGSISPDLALAGTFAGISFGALLVGWNQRGLDRAEGSA